MYEFAKVPEELTNPEERKEETDKKKKVSEMTLEEKKAYYAAEVEKLEKKLESKKAKLERIGNVTDKQRNHALIVVGSQLVTQEQLYTWYQLPPKEREKAILEYAKNIKAAISGTAAL